MSQFINFSELYNAGGSFARQEVIQNGTTTTVYGGYAPSSEPTADTDASPGWVIRRLIVTENGGVQNIECTWARASWNDRASQETVYKFNLPNTPGMYAEPQPPLD